MVDGRYLDNPIIGLINSSASPVTAYFLVENDQINFGHMGVGGTFGASAGPAIYIYSGEYNGAIQKTAWRWDITDCYSLEGNPFGNMTDAPHLKLRAGTESGGDIYTEEPDGTDTFRIKAAEGIMYVKSSVGIGVTSSDHTLDVAGNIGLAAGGYINWDAIDGSAGYGFRDNGGVIEYREKGGAWTAIIPCAEAGLNGSGADNYVTYWINQSTLSGESEFVYDYTNNRAGIGTTTPDFDLDISGDIRIEDTGKLKFGGTGSGDVNGNLDHDGTDFIMDDPLRVESTKRAACGGGATGSSIKYFYMAEDSIGTNADWVQMSTVTLEIDGVERKVYFQYDK